jgi:hypothetical protein
MKEPKPVIRRLRCKNRRSRLPIGGARYSTSPRSTSVVDSLFAHKCRIYDCRRPPRGNDGLNKLDVAGGYSTRGRTPCPLR